MSPTLVELDAGLVAGLVLAVTRVAGFAVASPFVARALPATGRLAFVVAVGVAITAPVDGAVELGALLAAATVNALVGLALGWLTGALFWLFAVAGGVIDFGSGLAVSQIFDPMTGGQAAVFGRWLPMAALVLFLVGGGLPVIVLGLDRSVRALPLDARPVVDGDLGALAVELVSQLFLAGVELALPLTATLLVTEVTLGVASRFTPQLNVFLVGLPAKIWVTLLLVPVVALRFPAVTTTVVAGAEQAFTDVLRGLIAGPVAGG